ncbi:MAG: shikimate kinase [Gammaproteobacteria bacterium]
MTGQHIVIIGFKHVGKSLLGRLLATKLKRVFIDLDRAVQRLHQFETHEDLNCRAIMQKWGVEYFQNLEHEALKQMLEVATPSVISLGGGTPLNPQNPPLLQSHQVILIKGEPEVVFARIMAKGKPAFFPDDQDPHDFFLALWAERHKIYEKLAKITVENDTSVELTLEKILRSLR